MNKKFRVWEKDLADFGCFRDHQWFVNNCSTVFNDIEWSEKPSYILEQFTGILDKNGREIYEGDIIEVEDDGQSIIGNFKVIYSDRWGEFMLAAANSLAFYLLRYYKFRIIGNIHENKELL